MKFTISSGQLAAEFNPFGDDYLSEILEAVAVAWRQMPKPNPTEIENRITSRLAGWLLNAPGFVDRLPFHVVPQHELPDINGKILGRLDICFKHLQSTRNYFAMEAKRLHVPYSSGTQTEYPAYVSSEGMMAFVEGQYSKNLPAGGMLGYVMDGNTTKAWEGLAARIEDRRDSLCLSATSRLAKSALAQAVSKGLTGTHLGETLHDLKTHALRLFHLLLPVATSS
jgi:hypothetical protein